MTKNAINFNDFSVGVPAWKFVKHGLKITVEPKDPPSWPTCFEDSYHWGYTWWPSQKWPGKSKSKISMIVRIFHNQSIDNTNSPQLQWKISGRLSQKLLSHGQKTYVRIKKLVCAPNLAHNFVKYQYFHWNQPYSICKLNCTICPIDRPKAIKLPIWGSKMYFLMGHIDPFAFSPKLNLKYKTLKNLIMIISKKCPAFFYHCAPSEKNRK